MPAPVINKAIELGRLKRVLGVTLLLCGSSLFADPRSDLRGLPLSDSHFVKPLTVLNECEKRLFADVAVSRNTTKAHIITLFSRYYVLETPEKDGYVLEPRAREQEGPRGARVEISVEEATELWRMSDWQTEGKRYQFLDAGFKRLAPESGRVNYAFLSAAEQFPGKTLRLRFSPEHLQARRDLYYLRWRMHDAVLRKYVEKKRYLSSLDFAQLTWATGWSDNSDAFGLLAGDPKPAEKIGWTELYDRLALTMQITYYGRRDYFRPSLRGALGVSGIFDFDSDDKLPFEFRLQPERQHEVAEAVYRRFDRATTCELTRYVRFADDLPRETHDLFLLKVLERLEGRGMRTILASTDHITARFFGSRYGFQILMELPNIQHEEKEYLSYLEVGSPRYEKLKADLRQSARTVAVIR